MAQLTVIPARRTAPAVLGKSIVPGRASYHSVGFSGFCGPKTIPGEKGGDEHSALQEKGQRLALLLGETSTSKGGKTRTSTGELGLPHIAYRRSRQADELYFELLRRHVDNQCDILPGRLQTADHDPWVVDRKRERNSRCQG